MSKCLPHRKIDFEDTKRVVALLEYLVYEKAGTILVFARLCHLGSQFVMVLVSCEGQLSSLIYNSTQKGVTFHEVVAIVQIWALVVLIYGDPSKNRKLQHLQLDEEASANVEMFAQK